MSATLIVGYFRWVEPKSYYEVTHKWFFSNMPFPHKFWYPRRYHQGYCDLINSMFDDPDDSQLVETEVSLIYLLDAYLVLLESGKV